MIRDEEDLLKAIREHVKNNFNAKIASINAEKNDSIKIKDIPADDDHFFIAGELVDLPNSIFCQISIDSEIETKNNVQNVISLPSITVEIAFDNPKSPGTYYRSLRYMRALYEIMADFESSAIEADGLQITKAIPMVVGLVGREIIVCGVGLSVAIG